MTQTMAEGPIRLRVLASIADFEAAEEIQKDVWQTTDRFVTPLHVMLTAQHNGGLVLGAFDHACEDMPRMVGFLFGFPGRTEDGRWKHCSHMLAVRAEYQSRGIGQRLKLWQSRFVQAQGLSLITWTVDPLLAHNNHLNFRKLGVICRRYHQNWYGSDIGGGIPSDRFEVEWHVGSSAPAIAALRSRALEAHEARAGRSAYHVSMDMCLALPTETVLQKAGALITLEVPRDYPALLAQDWDRALAFRLQSRALLSDLIQQGYLVADLCQEEERVYYLIAREETFA